MCNIFKLAFTLRHKCNKYNWLPWKMLNHAEKCYITRRKQFYYPSVKLFLIWRSGVKIAILTVPQKTKNYSPLEHTRISAPRWHESPGALCHPMPKAEGDITRQGLNFVSSRGWYSGIVARGDIWYMLCDIFRTRSI